jgi:DNA-binding transcriptional regulator LsrR (DeoR family)
MPAPIIILPAPLVASIRDRYAEGGISQARLATELGISETTIFRVVNRLGAYSAESVKPQAAPVDPGLADAAQRSADRLRAMLAGDS